MLKPCPFCGGSVHTFHQISGWYVYCENRKCLASVKFGMADTEEETIERWNTRYYERRLIDIGAYAENILTVKKELMNPKE